MYPMLPPLQCLNGIKISKSKDFGGDKGSRTPDLRIATGCVLFVVKNIDFYRIYVTIMMF